MHFDYTNTLPHEEKILKELIIPPVKSFFENALKVKRIPGKLRIPKEIKSCLDIPIPENLSYNGANADIIIVVSTYRGIMKYKRELNITLNRNQSNNANTADYLNFNNSSNTIVKNNNISSNVNTTFVKDNSSFKDIAINNISITKKNQIDNEISIRNMLASFDKKQTNLSDLIYYKNTTIMNDAFNEYLKNSLITNNLLNNANANNFIDKDEPPKNIFGWATYCNQDASTFRPNLAVMQYVSDIKMTIKDIIESIWTSIHELTHALGFDNNLFKDFVNENYEKIPINETIYVKSKLIGLQELLDYRNEYMEFSDEFLNFNVFDFIYNMSNFSKDFNNKTATTSYTDKLKNINNINKVLNFNVNSLNILDLGFIKNFISNKDLNKNILSGNLNKTQIMNEDYKNSSLIKNTTDNASLISKNDTINNIAEIILNKIGYNTYNYSKVMLPESDEYTEIIINNKFDFYTLSKSISNFSENTKIYIKSKNTKEKAREHFDCDTLVGMELERNGDFGTAYSHWSKRALNTDYMIGDSYGEYVVSAITLALLKDTGWYDVDYTKSELITWGYKKGCEFLESKCISGDIESKSIEIEKFNNNNKAKKDINVINNSTDISVDTLNKKSTFYSFIQKILSPYEDKENKKDLFNNYNIKGKLNIEKSTNNKKNYNFKSFNKDINKSFEVVDNGLIESQDVEIEPEALINSPIKLKTDYEEFCSYNNEEKCSINRNFRSFCKLYKFNKPLPKDYQYFNKDTSIGGYNKLGDYCPYGIEWSDVDGESLGSCLTGIRIRENLGENICENCRCFHSTLIPENTVYKHFNSNKLDYNIRKYIKNIPKRASCIEVKCKKETSLVNKNEYENRLYLLLDQLEVKCPSNGGFVSLDGYFGSIECPRADDLCKPLLSSHQESKTSAYNLLIRIKERLLSLLIEFARYVSNYKYKQEIKSIKLNMLKKIKSNFNKKRNNNYKNANIKVNYTQKDVDSIFDNLEKELQKNEFSNEIQKNNKLGNVKSNTSKDNKVGHRKILFNNLINNLNKNKSKNNVDLNIMNMTLKSNVK